MKRDLRWIEVYRTLGIMGVVFAHTMELSYPSSGGKGWWTIAISTVLRFIVPAFFLVSGFLLRRVYTKTNRKLEFVPFWKSELTTIVVPFLVWNVIYMFMFRLFEGQPILSWNTLFLLTTGYMQMYFIFVLIQFFLLYSLLHRYLTRKNLNYVLVASAVGSFLFYLSSEVILRTCGPDQHFFEWHYGKLFIAWGLFFFWGVWLCDHFDVFEKMSRKLGTLGFVTFLTALVYYWELHREVLIYGYDSRQYFMLAGLLFQFLAANFMLALLYRMDRAGISGKVSRWLARSGKDVYGIYMAHLLVLSGLIAFWDKIGLPDVLWVKVAVIAVSTWIVSQSLIRVCRRPRLSFFNRFLFGARA